MTLLVRNSIRDFSRSLKNCQYSTEGQKFHENSAQALVIITGNSLVFSRKSITSTGFYRHYAPGASAPVVVINGSPIFRKSASLTSLRVRRGLKAMDHGSAWGFINRFAGHM